MALWEQPQADGALAAHGRSRVALLQVDAGLRAAVPERERPLAERAVIVPSQELGPGQWRTESLGEDGDTLAALVVRGLGTRQITIAGRRSAELLAPGDVFRPWASVDPVIPAESRWASGSRVVVAVLDGRFVAAAPRWPPPVTLLPARPAPPARTAPIP